MQKNENSTPKFTLHQGESINDFELKKGFLSIHESAALYSFLTEIHQKLLAFTNQAICKLISNNISPIKNFYFENPHEMSQFTFAIDYEDSEIEENCLSFSIKISPNLKTNYLMIRGNYCTDTQTIYNFYTLENYFKIYDTTEPAAINTQAKIKTLDTLNTYLSSILIKTLGENWQSL